MENTPEAELVSLSADIILMLELAKISEEHGRLTEELKERIGKFVASSEKGVDSLPDIGADVMLDLILTRRGF